MDPITTTTVTTYTLTSNGAVVDLAWSLTVGDVFVVGMMILLLAAAGLDFFLRIVWRR